MPTLTLRNLILLFVLASAIATLINAFVVTYTVQKRALVETALESNRAYATKLAEIINDSLADDLARLSFSAKLIGRSFSDHALLTQEASRVLHQDKSFSSLVIADDQGVVIVTEPADLHITGKKLRSLAPVEQKIPLVSPAFFSIAGNLVVFLSHPIHSSTGKYLGVIGGTIHLNKSNSLHDIIGKHFHRDASSVYLVDQSRRLLYHTEPGRIGEQISDNAIIDAALSSDNGTLLASNSQGIDMLAGFARVPQSQWGIVVQQPLQSVLSTLQELMHRLIIGMIPMCVLGLSLIWWIASRISHPLRKLADYAHQLDTPDNIQRIEQVHANYYEAMQLKRALLTGVRLLQARIGQLNVQAQSDALTGLANRRALQETLALWQETGKPFAVLAADIDHFKKVNDQFGHDAGDLTLKSVAGNLRRCLRSADLPCRVGGEEFLVLLPDASLAVAADVAERIRSSIAATPIAGVGHISISLGVAHWQGDDEAINTVLKRADELLYSAKRTGRNRVVTEATDISSSISEPS
ncbi:diguanylate cyclase [Pseudomonas sp. SH1-B]